MKKTFVCNDSMIITIPIGNLKDHGAGQLMPEKFQCVFRDPYKVFVIKGRPKPLGAAQAIAGVFLCILGLILDKMINMIYTLPSVLFVVCGMLSYAAGKAPHMYMVLNGINGLVMSLLVVENLVALFLIYWLSKAVCRQHFNTLPIILLKQGDRDLKA
ncbi:uncharacterized protein LOC120784686 isoform X2 [Xiphias gladius]|uniref:uncharacterized protein LOC120784686 isoform X2 n=1 Tax=Xiphias gladius TaxID=8245 RepID=UPI001A97F1C8|nr:uncharacterized protein LOC120784686 isoform X2 [Xiphias gladius]